MPIERDKPIIPIAKPHRMLVHAYLAFGTDYNVIRHVLYWPIIHGIRYGKDVAHKAKDALPAG